MANKLTLLLSIFALFLLVANASIYRTTIFIDEENPSQQSCEQQIQQQQQLRQCQMHLRQQVRGRQQEGEDGLCSSLDDNQQQQYLRQCCQQLQQLDNRCRCPGLEQALRSQLQQGQIQGGMLRQAYELASQIPRKCNISPRQGCDFSSPNF
ncbi:hypothetical protein AB3S75_020054 [Citrus x aurantiifolia]